MPWPLVVEGQVSKPIKKRIEKSVRTTCSQNSAEGAIKNQRKCKLCEEAATQKRISLVSFAYTKIFLRLY